MNKVIDLYIKFSKYFFLIQNEIKKKKFNYKII